MNLKLKIAGNTLAQIIGKIISAGSTFLITLLIARNFGLQGFGDYEKIVSFVTIFYLIADFGLNAIAISEIKKDVSKKEEIYGLTLALRIILSLALVFIAVALLSFLPGTQNEGYTPFVRLAIIISSLTIIFQSLTTTNNLIFQEALRYDKAVIASSVASVVNLLLVFLFIRLNFSLIFVIFSYVISYFIYFLVSLPLLKTILAKIKPLFDLPKILTLFKKTLPLGITLIFNVIYFRSDIILLTVLRSTKEVAFYGLAYRFFEVSLVFPTFFMNALYPLLLDYKNQGKEKIKEISLLSGGFLLGTGIATSIFMFFLAPWLVSLTGNSFSESILALRILVTSLPIFFLTSLFMWLLVAVEKQKILSYIYGSTMIVNIISNLIFIPKYGYLASAAITGVTELIVLILTGFFIYQEFFNKKTPNLTN